MGTVRVSILVIICLGAAPLFASPFFIIQKDTRYTQTGTSAPTTVDSYDFFATVTTPGAFDGATVTVPVNNSLLTLALGGGQLQFGSGVVTSQSSFNSTYPTGVYSFHLTDSTNALNT